MALEAGAAAESCDRRYVREVVDRSGSSFRLGMRVLPRQRRDAMYAVYAFCREVDDIADEAGPLDERLARLDAWRDEIDHLYEGAPTQPISRALLAPVRDYGLPRAEFLAVIDGMEMDLRNQMQAPSLASLRTYCRRVAGAVGILSVHIFGADEPEATDLAIACGEALQLTNILRDLAEDAQLGRLYLPRELLNAHGITTTDIAEVLAHPALPQVCVDLLAMARERYSQSRLLIAQCDRRRLRPCILMVEVYERIADQLERAGWSDIRTRVSVSKPEKIWILLRHGLI